MWVVPSKPGCYLKMFPDLLKQEQAGEVFSLRKATTATQIMEINQEKWERCQDCHYYRHCYDVGMTALLLLNRREGMSTAQ